MSVTLDLAELDDGIPTRVEIGDHGVCVVRVGDRVHAVDDRCSHDEASLAEGDVEDGQVECWMHGATFDLATGAATRLPATEPVGVHPTTVADGTVTITLSTPEESAT